MKKAYRSYSQRHTIVPKVVQPTYELVSYVADMNRALRSLLHHFSRFNCLGCQKSGCTGSVPRRWCERLLGGEGDRPFCGRETTGLATPWMRGDAMGRGVVGLHHGMEWRCLGEMVVAML